MLSNSILAYYMAKDMYNHAPYKTEYEKKREQALLSMAIDASNRLREDCISVEEWHRIREHINYLCDLKKWPRIYRNMERLNYSINNR